LEAHNYFVALTFTSTEHKNSRIYSVPVTQLKRL